MRKFPILAHLYGFVSIHFIVYMLVYSADGRSITPLMIIFFVLFLGQFVLHFYLQGALYRVLLIESAPDMIHPDPLVLSDYVTQCLLVISTSILSLFWTPLTSYTDLMFTICLYTSLGILQYSLEKKYNEL